MNIGNSIENADRFAALCSQAIDDGNMGAASVLTALIEGHAKVQAQTWSEVYNTTDDTDTADEESASQAASWLDDILELIGD